MKALIIFMAICILIFMAYRIFSIAKLYKGLDKIIAEGAIIIDVRTTPEFASGHIEGAINIPLGSIRSRYLELDTSKYYITTCSHGLRSIKAEALLKDRGFTHVFNGGASTDLEKIVKKVRK